MKPTEKVIRLRRMLLTGAEDLLDAINHYNATQYDPLSTDQDRSRALESLNDTIELWCAPNVF
jgi:hypothetical protein